MIRTVLFFLLMAFSCAASHAQTTTYSPLSTWQSSFSRWEATRSKLQETPGKQTTRPSLPGLRPASVELLQDALHRKHPRSLSNTSLARQVMLSRYLGKGSVRSRINGRNQLNGAMAEALFLQRNSDWQYVAKPNAPQHDVYRRSQGNRPPVNGQVKFHVSGRASLYAADMLKDYRAHRFFVPDDHTQPLRKFWLNRYEVAKARGDKSGMRLAARNAGRVQPLGVTSTEVVASTKQAAQFVASEANAAYISLAAGIAMSLGQIAWDYAHGSLSSDQVTYRSAKAISLIGAGVATDSVLRLVKDGALRGTLRGNAIVGGVVLVAETSWNVMENGGLTAFRHPEFYEQLGGSVSAAGLGTVAGLYSGVTATGLASETGPFAPLIGAGVGFTVGAVVGGIAYIGGRSATAWLIESIFPEMYERYQQQQIAIVKEDLARKIASAQSLPK